MGTSAPQNQQATLPWAQKRRALKVRKWELNPAFTSPAKLCGRTDIDRAQNRGGKQKIPNNQKLETVNFIEDSQGVTVPSKFFYI